VVNDRRQIIDEHYLLSNGTMTRVFDLSNWGGVYRWYNYATCLNDNGWIAGEAYVPGAGGGEFKGVDHAFLLIPVQPGDANSDGGVGAADVAILLANYNKTGMAWARDDFDGNQTVDINDLSTLLTNYDKSFAASAGIHAVPEPSVLGLLVAASGMALLACARRK
jgi:hypothetical protein